MEDVWNWSITNNGLFSTKLVYINMFESVEESVDIMEKLAYKFLWGSCAPKRTQAIVWKLMKQRLPTKDNLLRRAFIPLNGDIFCTHCG